jgi:signal transduction histidine kinase
LHSPRPSSRSEQALLRGANRQRSSDAHQLLIVSALGLAILTAVSILLGWLAAGRALRPLRTINNTARRISATNLHQRLTLDGPPDEFTELGATLNELFGRLEASFEAQRRFVAHASHELRTPLTLTRAILDVALDSPDPTIDSLRSACQDAVQAGEQQEQLIDALLTLATSERGIERQQPFDLAHTAEHVLRAAKREIDQQRVKLNTALAAAPTVGDLRLVERLITNLVDNALQYNSAAGTVQLTTGVADGLPFVTVTNTGPIVPAAEINRLLEPFQRLNPTQNGSGFGLGLSIVQAIATAHDATLTAQARPEGGLDIRVQFPAQTPLPAQ